MNRIHGQCGEIILEGTFHVPTNEGVCIELKKLDECQNCKYPDIPDLWNFCAICGKKLNRSLTKPMSERVTE